MLAPEISHDVAPAGSLVPVLFQPEFTPDSPFSLPAIDDVFRGAGGALATVCCPLHATHILAPPQIVGSWGQDLCLSPSLGPLQETEWFAKCVNINKVEQLGAVAHSSVPRYLGGGGRKIA